MYYNLPTCVLTTLWVPTMNQLSPYHSNLIYTIYLRYHNKTNADLHFIIVLNNRRFRSQFLGVRSEGSIIAYSAHDAYTIFTIIHTKLCQTTSWGGASQYHADHAGPARHGLLYVVVHGVVYKSHVTSIFVTKVIFCNFGQIAKILNFKLLKFFRYTVRARS